MKKEERHRENKNQGYCSYLNDVCPYDIRCIDCEIQCSIKRAKQKLKEIRNENKRL